MTTRKESCKYGKTCYRKNPQHMKEFSHGSDEEFEQNKVEPECVIESMKTKKQTRATAAGSDVADTSKKRSQLDHYFTKTSTDTVSKEPESKRKKDEQQKNSEGCSTQLSEATGATKENVPLDPQLEIKKMFLVEMPQDFFYFWEFAKIIDAKNPSAAFASSLGLHLVGPYDVLAGKMQSSANNEANYLLHWRYYYDVPEFMTVIRGDDETQFHIGYFRDDPKELPVFLASNKASEDCLMKPRGENIFAAVSGYIDDAIKQSGKSKELTDLQKLVKQQAIDRGLSLDQRTPRMKARDKKVVSKTFHGAGIVVPVDKNGVGYRPVPESPTDLRKILKKIVESKTQEERDKNYDALTEIVTLVQFANDECDYGEGLELGIDVFCYGGDELHGSVRGLLPLAYQLLRRGEYAQVILAHLANRKRGPASELDELR